MFGAPSNVPVVGCRALITPVSYVQWLKEAVGGLSIPHRARGVKGQGLLRYAPDDILRQTSLGIPPDRNEIFA